MGNGPYGEKWKEWQRLWDESPDAGLKKLIGQHATLSNNTNPQFSLQLFADVYKGAQSHQGIQKLVDDKVETKFESWYDDFNVFTGSKYYDRKYWTKDKIKEQWLRKAKLSDYEASTLTDPQYITTMVENDYIAKRDAGAMDDKGKPTDDYAAIVNDDNTLNEGATGVVAEDKKTGYTKYINDTLSKAGVTLPQSTIDHFVDLMEKGASEYEIKNMLEGEDEWVKVETQNTIDEHLETLGDVDKEELEIFDGMTKEMQTATSEEFDRMAGTIGRVAKMMGGKTREDSYINDRLVQESTELAKDDKEWIAQSRAKLKLGQTGRRYSVEAGKFGVMANLTAQGGVDAAGVAGDIQKQADKRMARMDAFNTQKGSILLKRAFDRAERDATKQTMRLAREAEEAKNRANSKARRLGAIASPLLGMLGGMAGGPVGMVAGAMAGYGQNQLQASMQGTGMTAPSLNYADVGVGAQKSWAGMSNWWNSRGEGVPQQHTTPYFPQMGRRSSW